MAKSTLQVQPDGDKFAIVDANGQVVDTGFETRAAAHTAKRKLTSTAAAHLAPDADDHEEEEEYDDELDDDDMDELEGDDDDVNHDTPEETSEHNPHGLSAHQRISRILAELSKRGIKIAEDPEHSVDRNAQTLPQHFARRPEEGSLNNPVGLWRLATQHFARRPEEGSSIDAPPAPEPSEDETDETAAHDEQ